MNRRAVDGPRASIWAHWRVRRFVAFFGGIVLPFLCFFFDPAVFKTGGFSLPLGGQIWWHAQIFAYTSALMAGWTLISRLFFRRFPDRGLGFAAGVFGAASGLSLLLGLGLLPMSLIGLIFLIGIFGLVPFFTAVVYWKAMRSALRSARRVGNGRAPWKSALAGAGALIGFSLLAQWSANAWREAAFTRVAAEAGDARDSSQRFLAIYTRVFGDAALFDRVLRERDPAAQEKLAKAYQAITGLAYEEREATRND